MIHELLIGTDPKVRSVLTWNMLIGGPNQSYKVNFKEPLPARGKISKRTFAFCSVNPFPENIRKKFWEGTLFSRSLRSPRPYLARDVERREREHGNCIFLIKTFLGKISNACFYRLWITGYVLLKFPIRSIFWPAKKPNTEDREHRVRVSKLAIRTTRTARPISLLIRPIASSGLARERHHIRATAFP